MRRNLSVRLLPLLLLAALMPARRASCQGVRLAEKYKATLDYSDQGIGWDWISTTDDVWSLSSFGYSVGGALSIQLGPSTVVFGRHRTDVVWAAVAPDKPGTIVKEP